MKGAPSEYHDFEYTEAEDPLRRAVVAATRPPTKWKRLRTQIPVEEEPVGDPEDEEERKRAEVMHRLDEEGRFDSYANAGTRVNNYIRARIVNAALGLEEEKPDGQWLEEAVDEATDEDLVHMICEYLDSRPERKVGLAPSGNGIEARVGETQWDDSGHFGHASLRVVGWDFVSFDFKDQLRLVRELAQKIAPNLRGAIILEPRQCLSIHIQVAVILLRLRKKGEVPPVHEVQAGALAIRKEFQECGAAVEEYFGELPATCNGVRDYRARSRHRLVRA